MTDEEREWMRNRLERIEQDAQHWPRWLKHAWNQRVKKDRLGNDLLLVIDSPNLRVIDGGKKK
jgi:hypothetical protein